MYAAQLFAAVDRSIPNLRENILRGELTELFNWLKTHIWQKASTVSTDELIRSATGESLNPAYFQRHLRARYL
jgi:carboxypeptidase Taq